ncbi:RNA pseudouridine synthase [Verrucomicrobiaceae bacterium SCGC AG-212-N21]|nr:RNA pseudouridine synthase [Verrucomicrobiaceae bacterium SCGC AG-212-N21]
MEFTVTEPEWVKQRLDLFLHAKLPDMSRTRLQGLVKDGDILLNGKTAKPNTALKSGDVITIEIPEPEPTEVVPQDLPLDILFEDNDIVVVNKAEGMVVHPAAGNPDGTLVNALLFHCKNLSGIGGELRPGIVHRLDKETSGCMVVAKHDLAHTRLSEAFSTRDLTKLYLAAVNGVPVRDNGRIENRIGRHPVDRKRMAVVKEDQGKEAVTEWERLSIHEGCALILCRLLTGRTHQIRVHMRESLQTPILGDTIYAQPQRQLVKMPRLMLHAWKLEFTHPITKQEMKFEAKVPEVFAPWMEARSGK